MANIPIQHNEVLSIPIIQPHPDGGWEPVAHTDAAKITIENPMPHLISATIGTTPMDSAPALVVAPLVSGPLAGISVTTRHKGHGVVHTFNIVHEHPHGAHHLDVGNAHSEPQDPPSPGLPSY